MRNIFYRILKEPNRSFIVKNLINKNNNQLSIYFPKSKILSDEFINYKPCYKVPTLNYFPKLYSTKNNKSEAYKVDYEILNQCYGSGSDNWGDLSYFPGDYLNFGFYRDILFEGNGMSLEMRIESSAALYKEIIFALGIEEKHTVLEIGCGRGRGIIDILSKIPCNKIFGLDMNSEQLKKAKQNLKNKGMNLNIEFVNKNSENTGIEDKSIDRIYSIEVAQHFNSIKLFAKEMNRLLKPNGKLIVTTYFLKKRVEIEELAVVLPHVKFQLDKLHYIDSVCLDFQDAGFKKVSYHSIGEYVFLGYDTWLEKMNSNVWSRGFYQAYKAGFIDYYILTIE